MTRQMLAGLLLCLAFGGADSEASCSSGDCDATENLLLQPKFILHKERNKQEPISIDHAHIVCHSQGCQEAQAELTAIETRMALASEQLNNCATSRAQLRTDLESAISMRQEVEAALEECVTTRATLQTALDDCHTRRAEKTAALAECTTSRAALEEELRQCVDVDRPEAEKGLAECNEERARLEKELRELQGGGGGAPSPASAPSPARRNLLLQTGADSEDQADSSVAAKVNRIQTRLQELKAEEELTIEKLRKLIKNIARLAEQLEIKDAEFDSIANGLMEHFETEEDLMGQYDQNERKFLNATRSYLQTISGPVEEIRQKIADARAAEGQSLTELASEVVSQSQGTASLLQLKAEWNDARYKAAEADRVAQEGEISKLKALLEEKTKHGSDEECEELRADLVTKKMALENTQALLEECLTTKAELTAKIEQAETATELAQTALQECLTAKAKMQTQLEECNTACAELEASLQECLNAKQGLVEAIDECHARRDEARAALEECLKAKKELQEQIDALKGGSLLQHDKHIALVSHSRSMDELVSILRDLASRFIELINQQGEQDRSINKAVRKIRKILDLEKQMEDSASTESQTAESTSQNAAGQAIEKVAQGTQTMFDNLAAAEAANEASQEDIQE